MAVLSESFFWIITEPDLDHRDVERGMEWLALHPLSELIDKVPDPSPMNGVRAGASIVYV